MQRTFSGIILLLLACGSANAALPSRLSGQYNTSGTPTGCSGTSPYCLTNDGYAWAVRPGDIALVPLPGAVWLFGGALALLGALRRRAMTALG